MSIDQLAVHNVQVTWRTVLPVWWLLSWRWSTVTFVALVSTPYLDRLLDHVLLMNTSINPDLGLAIYLMLLSFGFLLMAAAGNLIVAAALKKHYAGFRIALISN